MRILGPLLEEVWSNLPDVNAAVRELLIEINHGIRRADGSTRFERFTGEEAATLTPLPALPFEQVAWKELKVGRNYHVTCEYQHYSVPFALAGRSLRARITSGAITLFDGERVVAEHARKMGRKGQYSTDPKHVPRAHQDVSALYSRAWFVNRANSIGPATTQVIEQLLSRYAIEAQSYLDCQNILGTLGKNRAKLEAASQQLLTMRGTPSYSTLKRLMASIHSDQRKRAAPGAAASTSKGTTTATTQANGVLVRDAAHYRDEEA